MTPQPRLTPDALTVLARLGNQAASEALTLIDERDAYRTALEQIRDNPEWSGAVIRSKVQAALSAASEVSNGS